MKKDVKKLQTHLAILLEHDLWQDLNTPKTISRNWILFVATVPEINIIMCLLIVCLIMGVSV